jgi:hypothetical protein
MAVDARLLEGAVQRAPLTGHEGKSGAPLERLVLADGRRVVVKRLDPASDLVMALTGDTRGRELDLFDAGVLDRLPPGVAHALLGGWRESSGTVLVMRDLGGSVLTWADRLDRGRWLFVVDRVARLHRAFLDGPPAAGLTPLRAQLGLFAPDRLRPHAGDANPLPRLALRGWELFTGTAAPDVASAVLALLDDLTPLVDALARRPCTLVHGDLATVNMALEGDGLVLLDWAMPAAAPGALDVARFVAGCASVVDGGSREQLLADYREAAGEAYDAEAMRLALLGGLVWLGWNKALDAAEHPDPAVRAREAADLAWWVTRGREALEAGLL